jgi:hypothetical protein
MKKLIPILLIVLVSQVKAQITVDTNFYNVSEKIDTIPCIILVSDTTTYIQISTFAIRGYIVRGVFGRFKGLLYSSKSPIKKSLIVWDVKEL